MTFVKNTKPETSIIIIIISFFFGVVPRIVYNTWKEVNKKIVLKIHIKQLTDVYKEGIWNWYCLNQIMFIRIEVRFTFVVLLL